MTKNEKALREMAEFLGVTIESLREQLPPENKLETEEDLLKEAQSVVYYFRARGKGFIEKQCMSCGELFTYQHTYEGVQYCSIPCMDAALREIGLQWNPGKPARQRWGRYIPAVVPPQALKEVQEVIGLQEVQLPDIEIELPVSLPSHTSIYDVW